MKFDLKGNLDLCDAQGILAFEDQQVKDMDLKKEVRKYINKIIEEKIFTGKTGEIFSFLISEQEVLKRYFLLGGGKRKDFKMNILRDLTGEWIKAAKGDKCRNIAFSLADFKGQEKKEALFVLVESSCLADYEFNDFLSGSEKQEEITFHFFEIENRAEGEDVLQQAFNLAAGTIWARDLVNQPADRMNVNAFAAAAGTLAELPDMKVDIYAEEEIEKIGMNAFLAVGRGAEEKPKLLVARYRPKQEGPVYGLVGKGIMYDSGGLSLKPTKSMVNMKTDMAGGAALLGLLKSLALNRLPVNVTAVVPICANMVSQTSYRPGDILRSLSGKTILVKNTDAEGRLTLADGLTYILNQEKVDEVIDIATLTGAAIIALGEDLTAVMCNEAFDYENLKKAAVISDEAVWQLPLPSVYEKKLAGDGIADLNNAPGNPGTITAGLFLQSFVQDVPWAHLDIAGPSWKDKQDRYWSKGATGIGVRLLYNYLKQKEKK